MNAQHEGGASPPKKNWWQRRSKLSKVALVIGALVVVGMIAGRSSDSKTGPDDASAEPPVSTTSKSAADTTGPQVPGRFHRDCFACGDLVRYIDTSDVSCGWDGDKVLVQVTMTNRSVEHVTVKWHPSYELVGGGSHGTGLTSIEDSGFEAGETRELVSEQNPDGVASGAEIGKCKPSFFLVESG